MRASDAMTRWLAVVLGVVLLAGLLFGYDQGVISGALPGIEARFRLDLLMLQVVTSWVTLGALLGSLVAGELGDRLGRKRTVLAAGALFVLGATLQSLAPDAIVLTVGRLVVGTGVGVAAVVAPLYAAECAPSSLRGRFVATYQLAIASGIFLAYLVDGSIASADRWRAMLGAAAVPGAALVAVAFVAPESPRWLLLKGRGDAAIDALRRLRPARDFAAGAELFGAAGTTATGVDLPLAGATTDLPVAAGATATAADVSIATGTTAPGAASWRELLRAEWRRPLLVALGLATLQQVTGINAVIYYAGRIFEAAGFATASARLSMTTWAIGGVNVLATLVAIAFIDRAGRRVLLLSGLVGMGASLAVVAFAFRFVAPPDGGVRRRCRPPARASPASRWRSRSSHSSPASHSPSAPSRGRSSTRSSRRRSAAAASPSRPR